MAKSSRISTVASGRVRRPAANPSRSVGRSRSVGVMPRSRASTEKLFAVSSAVGSDDHPRAAFCFEFEQMPPLRVEEGVAVRQVARHEQAGEGGARCVVRHQTFLS